MSEITAEHGHAAGHGSLAQRFDNLKFAMWLYIGSETVIFTILIAAYVVFRVNQPELVAAAHENVSIALVGANTFILLTSSWALVRGLFAIQQGNRQGLINWMWLVFVLGVLFVGLQYYEYQELAHHGVTLDDGGYGTRFYPLTAFHGAHVIIGVIWAFFVIRHAQRGGYSAEDNIGVEIFGLYWHFVDVVWVILFSLLYLI
jgi:heme/copper-type cytochrome/quinol oxidase subunit 3